MAKLWRLASCTSHNNSRITDVRRGLENSIRYPAWYCIVRKTHLQMWYHNRTQWISWILLHQRHQRHGMINDVIWRAFTRAKIPAIKEPNGLSRSDGKRPDGVTIIPWQRGRCLAWDDTVPDTFAASYEHLTSQNAGAAAEKAARNKESKYAAISLSHHF